MVGGGWTGTTEGSAAASAFPGQGAGPRLTGEALREENMETDPGPRGKVESYGRPEFPSSVICETTTISDGGKTEVHRGEGILLMSPQTVMRLCFKHVLGPMPVHCSV